MDGRRPCARPALGAKAHEGIRLGSAGERLRHFRDSAGDGRDAAAVPGGRRRYRAPRLVGTSSSSFPTAAGICRPDSSTH